MNSVELVGRLIRDPDVRYTSGTNSAVATFTLAVDRDGEKDKDGNKLTDFPRITVFGRAAEAVEKYYKKGRQVELKGRLQTGSYTNKKGETVYTTDVIALWIRLISEKTQSQNTQPQRQERQETFEEADDDVPF